MGFGLAPLLLSGLFVPLIALVFVWSGRERRRAELRFAGAGLSLLRSGRIVPLWRGAKIGLTLVIAALLALAVARPQIGKTSVVLPREGSDVVVAIDVSRSMGVGDVSPSRLDRAKGAAGALIDHLGGDRVGLVVFAGTASLRFPLTTDAQAARQVIDGVSVEDSGVKPGSNLREALATARTAFTGDKTRSKVIVLISDGEDLVGDDLPAAKDAADAGFRINTVGVGTAQGGQVFFTNPRSGQRSPVIDPSTGAAAVSHRDDLNLRQLAAAGQGSAYEGNSIDFAFDLSGAIDRLEKTSFDSGATTTPIERFQIPLALALGLLLFDSLSTETGLRAWRRPRRSRTPHEGDGQRTAVAMTARR